MNIEVTNGVKDRGIEIFTESSLNKNTFIHTIQ